MRFSPSTQAFYPEDTTYPKLPTDVITVTQAEWQAAIMRGPYDTLAMSGTSLVIVPGTAPALTPNQIILQQIVALELTVTQRRLREATLGIDSGWLKNLDSQIATLRTQLK